jgi:hypothetical protein
MAWAWDLVSDIREKYWECLREGAEENTVELGYNNIGYYDTSPIASNTQWYELVPHKATVFIPR